MSLIDFLRDKIHYRVRNTSDRQAVANELVSTNSERSLTPDQYRDLSGVPPELEWLATITDEKTRRAYKVGVAESIAFTNRIDHSALRTIAPAHMIVWRKDMG
jgi:hypothetical protein